MDLAVPSQDPAHPAPPRLLPWWPRPGVRHPHGHHPSPDRSSKRPPNFHTGPSLRLDSKLPSLPPSRHAHAPPLRLQLHHHTRHQLLTTTRKICAQFPRNSPTIGLPWTRQTQRHVHPRIDWRPRPPRLTPGSWSLGHTQDAHLAQRASLAPRWQIYLLAQFLDERYVIIGFVQS